ncbi:MAG: hypothetical protein F9K43_09845, partial [Bauldia sp.]
MTVQMPSARDTRIDVLRALALITIFINHIPQNPLEQLTSKNFGFSDAAEAFVLISGVSAALAYGSRFLSGAGLATSLKMWRRAGVLYLAQLGTTMTTLAIFAFFSLHFAVPELMTQINIRPVMDDTAAALVGIVTLGHQLGYNNILSMYAVVLLALPVSLLIARAFGIGAMVAASGALWLAAGIFRIGPPNFPNDGVWFLNPLSWQFLFVIGVAAAPGRAVMVEVNSETDFVARNAEFQKLVAGVAEAALSTDGSIAAILGAKMPSGKSVDEAIKVAVATIGENMTLRRAAMMTVKPGVVASYIH